MSDFHDINEMDEEIRLDSIARQISEILEKEGVQILYSEVYGNIVLRTDKAEVIL